MVAIGALYNDIAPRFAAESLMIQINGRGEASTLSPVLERGERGLAELRERVTAAGGQLIVESSVGRGSRVRATFALT